MAFPLTSPRFSRTLRVGVLAMIGSACRPATDDTPAPPRERPSTEWTDADEDGYSPDATDLVDCDDADPAVHPRASEACDGIDQDCDGLVDEDATVPLWRDADADGFGDEAGDGCGGTPGWSSTEGDCDDGDPDVHPGAEERCDDRDDDCDGALGEDERDADRDEWSACEGDCADTDYRIAPGLLEVCDGLDNDCDGAAPDEQDDDGDGVPVCDGDCEDHEALVYPDSAERCYDGLDNDCDGEVDGGCLAGCDVVVRGTVQGAIDLAGGNDVVCVPPGTWYGTVDFGGKELTLTGVDGAAVTILDGAGSGPVVRIADGEGPRLVLERLTVQGGALAGDGAGIDIERSSPTLRDLVVRDNEVIGEHDGAGIYVYGMSPTLTNIVVEGNRAPDGYGGGLALVGDYAILEGLSVVNNEALGGGGLYAYASYGTIDAGELRDNVAAEGGGAYVTGGAPSLANLRIAGNLAASADGTGWGGGVSLDLTSAELTNIAIVGNSATGLTGGYAGGIYADWGPSVVNVLVSDNSAQTAAGGAWYAYVNASYGDVYGNSPDDFGASEDPTVTDGNLSVDPVFVDDALHLDPASPLVDAGAPTLLDPDGSPSDIGMFGGPAADTIDLDGDGWPAWWRPGAYDAVTSPGADCDDSDATLFPGSGC